MISEQFLFDSGFDKVYRSGITTYVKVSEWMTDGHTTWEVNYPFRNSYWIFKDGVSTNLSEKEFRESLK